MNDQHLDHLLKSAPAPRRSAEYWERFPAAVSSKLAWRTEGSTARTERAPRFRVLTWGLGLAAVCVALGFALGLWRGTSLRFDKHQFAVVSRYYQEVAGMFPNQIQAIMLDQDGPRLVLSDKPNVPASTPYYVKICGPDGCQCFVTFSGQQVTVNGEKCEVLADADGELIILGSHAVWSQEDRSGRVRIAARPLNTAL